VHADRPSTTAAYVAMGRALAHARRSIPGFDDPYALELLPDDYRAAVERRIRREWPRTRREAMLALVAGFTERMMGPRTVEIDEGLRALPPGHQLVILGAGLDARAYRMRELSESVAFEVDHPASQAFKLRQTAGMRPCTRELHHVAVDFERERLGDRLAHAGHAPDAPTAWVFEGVISYLSPPEVEAAIDGIAERSAPGSRLLATYNEWSLVRRVFSGVTRRSGEPQRGAFSPEQMARLLSERGFVVRSDRDGFERARRHKVAPSVGDRFLFRFHHVVVADFAGAPEERGHAGAAAARAAPARSG
jgi:methyltransferase (TIGR00027 family)